MTLITVHGLLRKTLFVFMACGLFLALLFVKVFYNAQQEFALGETAYAEGAYKVALTHYERTIKWYTPFSTVIQHAVERLWQIGTQAEARDEVPLALEAYQTLRSSLYAVQSFYIPYQPWIAKSEERIAPLLAQIKTGQDQDASSRLQDTARFARQLQRPVGPHRGWSVLVEIGFLGWVGATIGMIWYVVDNDGKFLWRQGVLWGSCVALFFALWLIAMRLT